MINEKILAVSELAEFSPFCTTVFLDIPGVGGHFYAQDSMPLGSIPANVFQNKELDIALVLLAMYPLDHAENLPLACDIVRCGWATERIREDVVFILGLTSTFSEASNSALEKCRRSEVKLYDLPSCPQKNKPSAKTIPIKMAFDRMTGSDRNAQWIGGNDSILEQHKGSLLLSCLANSFSDLFWYRTGYRRSPKFNKAIFNCFTLSKLEEDLSKKPIALGCNKVDVELSNITKVGFSDLFENGMMLEEWRDIKKFCDDAARIWRASLSENGILFSAGGFKGSKLSGIADCLGIAPQLDALAAGVPVSDILA